MQSTLSKILLKNTPLDMSKWREIINRWIDQLKAK